MITEGERPKPPELISLYAAIPAVFGTLKNLRFPILTNSRCIMWMPRSRF